MTLVATCGARSVKQQRIAPAAHDNAVGWRSRLRIFQRTEILSGLRAAANLPGHPLTEVDVAQALADAEPFEIGIEAITWSDVHRAWALAQASLRFADAIYVAAAERQHTDLLTADARIERSGAPITCSIITVAVTGQN